MEKLQPVDKQTDQSQEDVEMSPIERLTKSGEFEDPDAVLAYILGSGVQSK